MLFKLVDNWMCVGIINDNREHLTKHGIPGKKLDDIEINQLRSNDYYNLKITVTDFGHPKNDWISYPYTMYLTKDYKFSSVKPAEDIPNSNLVSLSEDEEPIAIAQKPGSIGFGSGDCGDTFFAYGAEANSNGLFQSFSGPGTGLLWIRRIKR